MILALSYFINTIGINLSFDRKSLIKNYDV